MQSEDQKSMLKFYAKYSTLALQMIVIILAGAFGGKELDKILNFNFPYFTVSLTILCAIISIVYGSREIFRNKGRDNKNMTNLNGDDKK